MRTKRKKNDNEFYLENDSDDVFYFIAGYTDGGIPYGITWDEVISSELKFRSAMKKDAREVVDLIHLAIGDIAEQLTGERKKKKIQAVLTEFFLEENNRLSYENIVVADVYGDVVGIVLTYAGERADELDEPILNRLKKKTNNEKITLDKETFDGDFYIDTLAVHPNFQGHGIGSLLIEKAEELAKEKGFKRITLNVDKDNPSAKRLYERLGYNEDKIIIINKHPYDYMVKILD